MGTPQGDPALPLSLVRIQHPETMDMVTMGDYQQVPTLDRLPEASIQRNARPSPGQSRIPRLRARRGNVQNAGMFDMGVVTEDFSGPRRQRATSSQGTVIVPRATARPATPTSEGDTFSSHLFNNPPSPGGVWATNASNFASGSVPDVRFVTDMPASESEPRLNRDKGKGVDQRHHTEPFASGRDCDCIECDAQKKGLLNSDMIYAYLAMRGVQSGEGLFEDLITKYRENGRGPVVPNCPHARAKMNKEQEKYALKREGKRTAANVPSLARGDAGISEPGPSAAGYAIAGPSAAGPAIAGPSAAGSVDAGPSATGPESSASATLNDITRSFAGPRPNFPNSLYTFGTDFVLYDDSDDDDIAKGAITPDDFMRMASGVSRAETQKPLPPLPSNSGMTCRERQENENSGVTRGEQLEDENAGVACDEQLENENANESGNDIAVETESDPVAEVRDRVDEPGFRNQVCKDTMETLSGSYTVSSNPSVLNEAPGVRNLDRLRGAFGSLFSRMQPRLGERLDRIRLGMPQGSGSSNSVFSNSEYTEAEMAAALASPSATDINGMPPARVQANLAEAEHAVEHVEELEAAAHRRAIDASQRLDLLRNTLGRITAGANYIAERRSSSRRAKIRRSVSHRLRGLEYRRVRAMDGLRAEEARYARDSEAIVEAEESVERVLGTVDLPSVEEVLGEASRLWVQANGPEENE